ncbi:MAG TPA: phosphate-binding protein, partial [Gammaproteobacteria bacterium]|nr:phosphate-binding protein [Gammaproteobacteria bacterium]
VAATAENVVAGRYPLARFLYIYINKEPNRELPPLEREFLKLILSEAGQQVVLRDGYVPLPANIVELARRSLGLDS